MTDATVAGAIVRKVPTGIPGLDEITYGGLPAGRPTLVCGGPGSGKTLLGITFLVNGAREFGEPGVLMSFEQNAEELAQDVGSLGYDLASLVDDRKLVVDYVHVDRSEIEETGEYDLEGLFVRLEHAVNSIGARRVVLDTIESLFAGLENETILRAELRRLFRWLRDRDLTAVITGEKGETTLTRHGLEEYVTDAVIQLDHRVFDQISTRRLRVVKYRGSHHGTNEYPFLIDEGGLSVLPVTSLEAAAPGLVRARLERPRAARRDARRRGLLSRQHRARLRNGRHRKDHAGRALRRRRLQARGPQSLFSLRGVAAADATQHAVVRHRPGALR